MKPMFFSTLEIPESHRAEIWIEEFARTVARTDVVLQDKADCIVDGIMAQTKNYSLFCADIYSPMKFLRTKRLLADSDDGFTLLIANIGGFNSVDRHGNEYTVQQGQAVFISHSELGGTSLTKRSKGISVSITLDQLGYLSDEALDLLMSQRPFSHELLSYLCNISKTLFDADLNQGQLTVFADKHIAEITKGMLRDLVSRAKRPGRKVTASEIIDLIALEHNNNPYVSAHSIAEQLRCSVRQVHYLLQETGLQFSIHVTSQRIAAAKKAIEDGNVDGQKMIDLAINVGFSDVSYFNRSFKRATGCSPSQYKKRCKAER